MRGQLKTTTIAISLCVGELTSQSIELGQPVECPDVSRWLHGLEAGGLGERPVVVGLLPEHPLRARRAMNVLRGIAATGSVRCGVARDRDGRTRAAFERWIALPSEGYAAVLDAESRLLAVVPIGVDLEHCVEDVVLGSLDASIARTLAEFERLREIAKRTRHWGPFKAAARNLQSRFPLHPVAWLAELREQERGEIVDRVWLRTACDALESRPEFQARLMHRAFELDATLGDVEWVRVIFNAIAARACRAPDSCAAAFVSQAARGMDAAATASAFALIEACKGSSELLTRCAAQLGAPSFRGRFGEARLTAIELAMRERPGDVALARDRFQVLAREIRDWVGADRVGRVLVRSMHGDARALNSFAWRLMTESPYRGNLRELALHAARAMASDADWRTYWRLDTLALAEFQAGNVVIAVRLQEEAVEGCDAASKPRYRERLANYRAALSASDAPTPSGR